TKALDLIVDLRVLIQWQDTLLRTHGISFLIGVAYGTTALVERGYGFRTRGGMASTGDRATSNGRAIFCSSSSRIRSSNAMHAVQALETIVAEETAA
ncbi:hypothetical protein U1Q18_031463, partial [Sarracenia purpurea var. burkii]